MVQTRNRKLAVALTLIACATAVLSISGSGAVLEQRGTGHPQLVSVQPLPELGGEMCYPTQLASSSPPESLAALMQQLRPNSASASGAPGVVFDRAPARTIKDAYPNFSGVVVDPIRNEIVVQDQSLGQILVYDRTANTPPRASFTEPKRVIAGPKAKLDFEYGLYVDPQSGDIYSVANDIGNRVAVFKAGAKGNVPPDRVISNIGYAAGIAVDEQLQELYVTESGISVYRKEAQGKAPILRRVAGPKSRLGNTWGIALDRGRKEIFVSGHGVYSAGRGAAGTARYDPPLITVHPMDAQGDVAPLRVIQGPKTRLNWPALIFVDEQRRELYVANDGDHSILVFPADANGDVAPSRVIQGSRTGLRHPHSVFVDSKNDELVVANLGNHSVVVFPRNADGNAAPVRTIRSAPAGKLSLMIVNPGAVAYDSKRDQILAPN